MPKPTPVPSQDVSPASERQERARGVSGGANETVAEKPRATRRRFTAAEKLRLVKKADACVASGKRGAPGAMLREEGIYSSHLSTWRAQLAESGVAGLKERKAGRKPRLDAKDRIIAQQAKRIAKLERKLHVADALIELQKKRTRFWG